MEETKYLKSSCLHCGGHIVFPEAGVGQTIPCPHCGQSTLLALPAAPGLPRSRTALWAGLGVGVIAAGIGGFFYFHQTPSAEEPKAMAPSRAPGAGPKPAETKKEKEKSLADLRVATVQFEKTEGTSLTYAVGKLKNDSAFQRFGVKLELKLIDAGGRNVGLASDYAPLIEPHAEWSFHALVTDPRAIKAEVSDIKEE